MGRKEKLRKKLKDKGKSVMLIVAIFAICLIAFLAPALPAYGAELGYNGYNSGSGATDDWGCYVTYGTQNTNGGTYTITSWNVYMWLLENTSSSYWCPASSHAYCQVKIGSGGWSNYGNWTRSSGFTIHGGSGNKVSMVGAKNVTINKTHSAQTIYLRGAIYVPSGSSKGTQYSKQSGAISVPARTSYTIYYNANGGSGTPGNGTKWYNEVYNVPSNTPTRTGYTFTGYRISETGYYPLWPGGQISAGSNGNYTCVAQWTANTYDLVVDPTGGTLEGSNFGNYAGTSNVATVGGSNNGTPSPKLQYGTSNYCDLGTATRTGYTFNGFWTAKSGGTKLWEANGANNTSATSYWNSSRQWVYTGGVTVYAQWTEHTATLTYNANGHGTAPAAVTMRYSQAATAADALTENGYVFKEWNTKADGTGTSYPAGSTIKAANVEPSNLTLYAIWKHPGTITITKQWNDDLTGQDAANRKPPVIKIEGERVPQQ